MNLFNQIRLKRPKLNKFDLSHERKFSCNMGELVPIMLQEVLPGDKFRVNSEIMMRLAPMLAPVMHRVNVFTHYFFVPNRLVWNEWEDFITGGRLGTSSPVHPYVEANQTNVDLNLFVKGELADYCGIPPIEAETAVDQLFRFSLLPFRAYQMIYNEFYRDQNVEAEVEFGGIGSGALTDPDDLVELFSLRNRGWEKDYFTSCLPFAQRGGAATVPFEAEVTYRNPNILREAATGNPINVAGIESDGAGNIIGVPPNNVNVLIDNIESIGGGDVTINDLRRSVRLQEWLEKNARGGARYIEQILSHFGVMSSDARLQRPEYLGGGKQPIVMSEVLSTFQQEAEGLPQGNMSGHGMSVGRANGFKKSFEEHGFVIGIMSVLPRTNYQDGVHKMFTRFDKFDYPWPEFANIGEQEVKVGEIFADYGGPVGEKDEVFGYQSRYAEMKYGCSTVHGDMRDELDFWHLGRKFATKPVLNTEFIRANPSGRIFAVEDLSQEHLWCQVYNRLDALRPLPYFGTPTL